LQGEFVVPRERDDRREVEFSLEPWLDLVNSATLDLERVLAVEDA
jgi:hypothetical protein